MKIYLDFSQEVQEIFADSKIDISQILTDYGIDAKVILSKIPVKEEPGATSKPLVPLIIASSIAIVAISQALTQILKTIYSKPHWIEYTELDELRDATNNVVFDSEGNPIYKQVKKYSIVETHPKNTKSEFESEFSKAKGIILKVKTEDNEIVNE